MAPRQSHPQIGRVAPSGRVGDAAADDERGAADDAVRLPRRVLARLCADAVGAGVALGEVEHFIRGDGQPDPQPEIVQPHRPMRVYTLGRFSLVKGDQSVAFNGKSPHKPVELLQALIALGGRDVHTELLMAAVWPADESTDPRNLFDNTLHRLRRLLECDAALVLRDAKLTLMADQCWVDAWAFDRLAGQHAAAPAPAAAGQALQLYQGHFLQRESSRGWMHGYRDRLRSRFQRLVATEGSRLEACGRLQDAVAFYERGIELDPLAEALYQRLMCCHRDQGALADVLSVYRRCREHLQFEFGIEPAAATQAIRRTACGVGASPTP